MLLVLPLGASPVRTEDPPLMLLKPGELTKRPGGDLLMSMHMQHLTAILWHRYLSIQIVS